MISFKGALGYISMITGISCMVAFYSNEIEWSNPLYILPSVLLASSVGMMFGSGEMFRIIDYLRRKRR
jgi:hypothetical protein